MKITLTTLLLSALVLVGCADDSSFLTSPETQITKKSNSSNRIDLPSDLDWIELPSDLGQGFRVDTGYSVSEQIKGNTGGMIKLDVIVPRPGHPLGDFEVHAKVTVQKNSFAANETRTFTVSLDPEYCILNVTPSPSTLDKQLVVDLYLKGIDASQINTNTYHFVFIGDNGEILDTKPGTLQFSSPANWLRVKGAKITAPTNVTPPGIRYSFIR